MGDIDSPANFSTLYADINFYEHLGKIGAISKIFISKNSLQL